MKRLTFFASAPRHVEDLLAQELHTLGATGTKVSTGGVSFSGTLDTAYRSVLWSRLANRVFLKLETFTASSPRDVYERLIGFPWDTHFHVSSTFKIDATLLRSSFTHSQHLSQVVKDAVADSFRKTTGERPDVNLKSPDIRFHIFIKNTSATLYLDLSGESLHRRKYRVASTTATLKENVAAAILERAGWRDIAAQGGALIDIMCGSGTFLIEGALMAADIAPGLFRKSFGFQHWKHHDATLWNNLRAEAERKRRSGLSHLPEIYGFDAARQAIHAARRNIAAAGLSDHVSCRCLPVHRLTSRDIPRTPGLVVVNPPYGERLDAGIDSRELYALLGSVFYRIFQGWRATVFAGSKELARAVGLRAWKTNTFYNGAIEGCLAHFHLSSSNFYSPIKADAAPVLKTSVHIATPRERAEASHELNMFENRLEKRLRHLRRWANRNGVSCYRVYDADIPQFNVAIDLYEAQWAVVQEYAPPSSVPPEKSAARLQFILDVLPEALNISPDAIFLKRRIRGRAGPGLSGDSRTKRFMRVTEGGLTFLVNFTDYLDTGLFLDNRITRQLIRELAGGRRFLNLFAYTCTASVHAARGGAVATTSVDASRTYLQWGKQNFRENGFRDFKIHRFVCKDVMSFLETDSRKFGLIFADPPTFSNSHDSRGIFDVQKDHLRLIEACMKRLQKSGILIFSTNFRKFRLHESIANKYLVRNISRKTLPEDFKRNPRIHSAWEIRYKSPEK